MAKDWRNRRPFRAAVPGERVIGREVYQYGQAGSDEKIGCIDVCVRFDRDQLGPVVGALIAELARDNLPRVTLVIEGGLFSVELTNQYHEQGRAEDMSDKRIKGSIVRSVTLADILPPDQLGPKKSKKNH